jgi:hypothetical protein
VLFDVRRLKSDLDVLLDGAEDKEQSSRGSGIGQKSSGSLDGMQSQTSASKLPGAHHE